MRAHKSQHHAKYNDPPPQRADEAALWLVNAFNSGELTVDWVKIKEERKAMEEKRDLIAQVGFDCSDRERWAVAFSEFYPFTPASVRTPNPHRFLVHVFRALKGVENADLEISYGIKATELFFNEYIRKGKGRSGKSNL